MCVGSWFENNLLCSDVVVCFIYKRAHEKIPSGAGTIQIDYVFSNIGGKF
jgi:hypothetical protein